MWLVLSTNSFQPEHSALPSVQNTYRLAYARNLRWGLISNGLILRVLFFSELYLTCSWEAGILLDSMTSKVEAEETSTTTAGASGDQGEAPTASLTSSSASSGSKVKEEGEAAATGMPQFVETLSIYRVLKPNLKKSTLELSMSSPGRCAQPFVSRHWPSLLNSRDVALA